MPFPFRYLSLLASVFLAGCVVGPDYKKPDVATPEEFRFEAKPTENSFADLPWWEVFKDPILHDLIGTALKNNYDVKQSVARVEQARNQALAVNSALFPQVGYGGDIGRGRNSLYNAPANLNGREASSAEVSMGVSWQMDLWGLIRRSSEAARAQYLATDEARRGVMITLVSDVATTYFQLLALDRSLEIQRDAAKAFKGSYNIFNDRLINGVASKLETNRAAAALANASAQIPQIELQIAVSENQLNILLGRSPRPVTRDAFTLAAGPAPEIPSGLPSQLLRRRPDIRAAEQSLIAANAQVGVSVANFFPQIGLTMFMGRASPELSAFNNGAGNFWDVGGTLVGPIFQGGKLRAGNRAAKAKYEEAAAAYQQRVLTAFQEVSNALVTRQKEAEIDVYEGQAVEALTESVSLATQRYLNGKASYYEVLQAQQELYPSRQRQVQAQVGELIAVVELYKALGGGWQTAP